MARITVAPYEHTCHPPRTAGHPGPGHWRHDLRQLRGPRRARAAQGAWRAGGHREPGHRVGPHRLCGAARCGRPGHGCPAAPRRAQCGLRAARGGAGRCARGLVALGRFFAGGRGPAAVGPAGAAHAGRSVRRALDAARLGAVCAGHAGAVHSGGAVLQGGLARAQGAVGQHGSAGGDWHLGGLGAVDVAVAHGARGACPAPVFRSLGGGGDAGAAGQVAGGARQAPDHGGHPRTARAAPRCGPHAGA